MPKPLTELERRVLDYLIDYLRSNTYQPSIREIGREFSIKSTKTVSELLQSLADKGWIERDPSRSRGVRLLGMELRAESVTVPLYDGTGAAGAQLHFQLDSKLVTGSGAFLFVMVGDHLREDCIRAGDLLLIEPVSLSEVESGDAVLVRTGEATTVRRCVREGARYTLEPDAAGEAPLRLSETEARSAVQGRVASVIRRVRPPAVHASRAVDIIAD